MWKKKKKLFYRIKSINHWGILFKMVKGYPTCGLHGCNLVYGKVKLRFPFLFKHTSQRTRFACHRSVRLTLLNSKLYVCAYLIPFRKILRASGIVEGLVCKQSLKAVQPPFAKPSKLDHIPTYVANALPNH